MFFTKKANCDLLLLLLLVLRIELNNDFFRYHSFNREPVVRSVRLGSTSAYTQISHSASYLRYPHPKSLDQNELDEAAILFNRLNYITSVRRDREDLIVCIVNPPDDSSEDKASSDGITENALQSSSRSEVSNSVEDMQLTREEMDLIEILWKQDIDLGVTREAYDSRQTIEPEKLKDLKFVKESDIYNNKKDFDAENEEPLIVPDPFAGLNYTIDSETGEYLFEEFQSSLHSNIPNDHFSENKTRCQLIPDQAENEISQDLESLSNSLDLDTFLPFEDNDFCDLTELFSSNELSELVPEDLTSNPNYFLSPIEDIDKEFQQFEILSERNDSVRADMYPSIDDCWPDATTIMPLLAVGSTYQGPLTPFQSTNLNSAVVSNDGLILQTSTVPAEEEFQSISPSISSSNIGYAVAESIATLTNGSDPTPTGSVASNMYGEDLPELMYTNHTVAVANNDIISDLFLDELQLMTLPTNDHTLKKKEDHQMDTSSDSISSGNFPSTSQCRNWVDSSSESSSHYDEEQNENIELVSNSQLTFLKPQQDCNLVQNSTSSEKSKHSANRNQNGNCMNTTFQPVNCNDQQFFTLKTYYSDPSENSACAISCGFMNLNKKFDYTIPKATSYNCSNILQHNHTYHMPFSNEDSNHKQSIRDKQKAYDDEDACNKDEKRAKELKLPISIPDIINLAIEEYNERLSKYELTEAQITLIRDIRRRGKNKVAAQNCRKRKMDQINNLQQDLDYLQNEKLKLKMKQNHLIQKKHIIEEKCIQLYELIMQNTNRRPPSAPAISSPATTRQTATSDTLVGNFEYTPNGGTRTKRKFKK